MPAEKIFDYTTKTIGKQRVIVFPDVAVGDRLRTVSRTIQKQPEIQGGFFLEPVGFLGFSDASAHVTLDAPTDMKLHISTKGLREKITKGPVRTRYEWDVIPTPYKGISADLLSLATYTARLQISSFADWQTAGQAYCSAVGLATTVTPDIAALAKQITSGKSGRINQAKAIFDWLDENITESDIPNATLTPKPASVTLSARHGDASDVAVLLHALLTASGIEAYPVRSDHLRLTDENDVPNPSLGTAIVYLPEFDLYADPKPGASKVAFGVLNEERYGRQALRCGPETPQLIRIQTASADTHTLTITTNITVSSEGGSDWHIDDLSARIVQKQHPQPTQKPPLYQFCGAA